MPDHDDHEDLRDFLRAEGLDDGSGLQQAVDDPLLAEDGERALAQALARRHSAHQHRRLVGVLAAAAASVALAAGTAGVLLHPGSPATPALSATPTSPAAESPPLAPLAFTAHPTSAGPALEERAQASSGYASDPLRSAPPRARWYEWDASSPKHGRLVDVTPQGTRSLVETFQMPAPQDGRVQVADRGPLQATTTVATAPSAETVVADALAVTREAGCAGEPSVCVEPDSSPLLASPAFTSSPALQALATLAHARTLGTTTDRLGRPATGFAADLGSSQQIVVLVDPETGAFLGADWIDGRPAPRVTRIIVAAEPRS